MAFLRAWIVLFFIWMLCVGLVVGIRTMTHRQAVVWLQVARWATVGALMAVAIAALIIHLF